ncbi:glycoside hydrolase family 3 C-terminal domain-containing protein [Mangrovibacterium lignilyticum]|uniref:glycoside hydrolase family 3 C-terminal domain-containing protein n=1 Tax=Mangrovibacterium lignilyticum TaxID=2668052 RepID=UPI001EE6267D|nr:glycoside hydrolase family 3 C-terminal domain-containing protein [Mangrovibacterium lignilyticum]
MKNRLKKTSLISKVCLFSLTLGVFGCSSQPKQPGDEEVIKNTISKMTLDQKAEVLIGTGMFMDLPDSIKKKFGGGDDNELGPNYKAMVDHIRTYLPGAAGNSSEFPELGVTCQVLTDGPAGLRIQPTREGEEKTYYCTAFPIATVLASSWDTDLVYKVGEAMGNEVLEYGSDVLLAPGMNIQRDPLCGRNFEYYSEDPLVTGKMAAAMVKGIQSNGVGTSIKHFAANNQETNRMSVNTVVSQRALREIYLKGFEIAVKEAQPWTVMSSYNKLNGVYTSESHGLLTDVLRNDWGFEGYVMTDWGGGSDVIAQMKAGNDMIQPGQPKQVQELSSAVNQESIDEAILDKNLSRIFGIMLKTPKYKGYAYSCNPDLKAHAEVTRQAATDGMVLLENRDQALPIAADVKKVAAFGNTSYDFIAGGTGSGDVNEAYTISLMEGLENGGYATDAELTEIYQKYIEAERAKGVKTDNWLAALMHGKIPVTEMPLSKAIATKMAAENDMALITIGRNSGEGGDRKAEAGDFYLTDTEKAMIKDVTDAFHAKGKKAIVVLNVGGAIETASWAKTPDAVLLAWQPGQEAGNSVVDVLSGKVNPSGKLAVSFPVSYDDAPTSKTFPGHEIKSDDVDNAADLSGFSFMKRTPWEVVYDEDIYVGYRYYNTFDVPVAYEFGYGLSYTNFEYSNLQLSATNFDGELTVSVDVKNTGSVGGREVVQVYASAPQVKLEKPEEELVAFGKTKLLNPDETVTLSFTIKSTDLASFDEASSSWLVEAGNYTVKVGASSVKINQSADFSVASDIDAGSVSNVLAPEITIEKLSQK